MKLRVQDTLSCIKKKSLNKLHDRFYKNNNILPSYLSYKLDALKCIALLGHSIESQLLLFSSSV